MLGVVALKFYFFTVWVDRNHKTFEHTTLTAINGDDLTSSRGSVDNADTFFIFKNGLTFSYDVAFFDIHRGLHAHIIIANKCHMGGSVLRYLAGGFTSDG